MSINEKDMIRIGDLRYITLVTALLNETHYAFVNALTEEGEATEQYLVLYEDENQTLQVVGDTATMNILIPIFQQKLKSRMGEIFN